MTSYRIFWKKSAIKELREIDKQIIPKIIAQLKVFQTILFLPA
jgi:mRNA-degrading endonuclease RelE of RelBE toxin-antitoxin system